MSKPSPSSAYATLPQGRSGFAVGTSAPMLGLAYGWRLGRIRLVRRQLVLLALLATSVTFALSVVEREAQPFGAVDRALDAAFHWIVPLICFSVSGVGSGRHRLTDTVWGAARFGLSRRCLILGLVAAVTAASVVVNVLVAELAVVTSMSGSVAWVGDVWACAWIAALGSAAYVGWFVVAAQVFRSGTGRWLVLALDFFLGDGTGALAVPWPRAHLHSLIGGAPVLEMSQAVSSSWLLATVVLALGLLTWRAGS